MRNRIPKKSSLARRGVIPTEDSVECVGKVDTAAHLFLHCNYSAAVWYVFFKWLGLYSVCYLIRCLEFFTGSFGIRRFGNFEERGITEFLKMILRSLWRCWMPSKYSLGDGACVGILCLMRCYMNGCGIQVCLSCNRGGK